MEGVHQRFHSYVVGDVDLRDDGFELLHELPEALPISMSEVPKVYGGSFLVSEHDVVLEKGRREVMEAVDGVFLETSELVEGRSFEGFN